MAVAVGGGGDVFVFLVAIGTAMDAVGMCGGMGLGGGICNASRCSGSGVVGWVFLFGAVVTLVFVLTTGGAGTTADVRNFKISSRRLGSSIIRSKA